MLALSLVHKGIRVEIFTELNDQGMVTRALVISWPNYCNMLYVWLPLNKVQKL